MPSLDQRVAIVTGGASGIGLEFSRRLASDGAAVVIVDIDGATEAAARLISQGLKAIGVRANVSSEDDVAGMVEAACSTFGGLDILVNNAALFSTLAPGPFSAISVDDWQKVMAVNVLGPFLTARAAVSAMRARGAGRIVNIASNTVHKGAPGLLHYVTSKGAVIGMTRALARELGADNITVNALAPGFTLSSGVTANAAYQDTFKAAAVDVRAIRRDQVPQDLVGALAFLASDDAAFMTGQTLVVDGGNIFL
ncbi:dehydrogenase [Sphingobium sp. SCG-1]|uniref:SDR family NAD(P)-dependent oxidoreductase n=1 Tax=Sphingobium sp. SCG-1 TaxID=2072936 RepID=UPI000CD681AD|nr:glucose 1-dehydrogenase [Sphingobium sp. SCG-1]AUW57095.1 dehydrogenase [Sphingobium sp. SCG-1]